MPIKSIAELIAYAKANPGKLNYGSAGPGSAPHMGLALARHRRQDRHGARAVRRAWPRLNAVMAGTVDLSLTTVPFAKPQAEAGTIRVLAITGTARDPLLPDVPTLQESGLPVTTQVFFGLLAPAQHAGADHRAAAQGDGRDRQGAGRGRAAADARLSGASILTGDAYRDTILKDLEQWRGVAKAANIQITN